LAKTDSGTPGRTSPGQTTLKTVGQMSVPRSSIYDIAVTLLLELNAHRDDALCHWTSNRRKDKDEHAKSSFAFGLIVSALDTVVLTARMSETHAPEQCACGNLSGSETSHQGIASPNPALGMFERDHFRHEIQRSPKSVASNWNVSGIPMDLALHVNIKSPDQTMTEGQCY
jgi:hypothetical protein